MIFRPYSRAGGAGSLLHAWHPSGSPENIGARLLASYAQEVSRVEQNGDGVISFVEADVNGTSDGLPNTLLYLPATAFNRVAITREIDDGFLAPRFAPSQRAYILSGPLVLVEPAVSASIPRDADDGSSWRHRFTQGLRWLKNP